MTKAIFEVGFTGYVLDVKDALLVAELLSKAEKYEQKYGRGVTDNNTHHIYPNNVNQFTTIKLMSDELYRMAKLAGPPTKD